jgi:hypothetical protein
MDTERKKIYRTYPGRIASGRKNPDPDRENTVLHNYLRVNTLPLICMIYRWIIMATREQCRDPFPLPLPSPTPNLCWSANYPQPCLAYRQTIQRTPKNLHSVHVYPCVSSQNRVLSVEEAKRQAPYRWAGMRIRIRIRVKKTGSSSALKSKFRSLWWKAGRGSGYALKWKVLSASGSALGWRGIPDPQPRRQIQHCLGPLISVSVLDHPDSTAAVGHKKP